MSEPAADNSPAINGVMSPPLFIALCLQEWWAAGNPEIDRILFSTSVLPRNWFLAFAGKIIVVVR